MDLNWSGGRIGGNRKHEMEKKKNMKWRMNEEHAGNDSLFKALNHSTSWEQISLDTDEKRMTTIMEASTPLEGIRWH